MRKITIFILTIIMFTFISFPVQARELEISYPDIRGTDTPTEVETNIEDFAKYIYYLLLGISGLLAFGVIVYAGIQWFTSAGNPEKINDARERITAAFIGLVILFGSFLILNEVNPNLLRFKVPRLRPILTELPSGVLLCNEFVEIKRAWNLQEEFKFLPESEQSIPREKEIIEAMKPILEEIPKKCYTVNTSGNIRGDFDNKVKYIYFIPKITEGLDVDDWTSIEYGAITYENSNYNGATKVLLNHLKSENGLVTVYGDVVSSKPSSIKVFSLNYDPDPNWKIALYDKKDLKTEKNAAVEYYLSNNNSCGASSSNNPFWWCKTNKLPFIPLSMRVEGKVVVILETDSGKAETFSGNSDYNNLKSYRNLCKIEYDNTEAFSEFLIPDTSKATIFSGSIY